MNKKQISALLLGMSLSTSMLISCSEDTPSVETEPKQVNDYAYVGKQVGNFSADEWLPGGELGTTMGTEYEVETPAIEKSDLSNAFLVGEAMFEHDFMGNSSNPNLWPV